MQHGSRMALTHVAGGMMGISGGMVQADYMLHAFLDTSTTFCSNACVAGL